MKGKLLIVILVIPTMVFSQKKSINLYGNASILIKKSLSLTKSPPIGAGAVFGGRFSNFGVGVGFQTFKVEQKYSAAYPVFGDLRYFFKQKNDSQKKNILPFVAVDFGKLIWNTSFSNNTGPDNTVYYYNGRTFFAVEAGMHLFQKLKKQGMYLSIGYSYISSNFYKENTNSYRIGTGGIIVIGEPVITKSSTIIVGYSDLYFKIGYQF